jgi:host factor-I protein
MMAFRSADSNFRKSAYPPEDTHQEAAYLRSLGEKQKPVRIKLMDGEEVRGWIEYYDRRMIRLTRNGAPNLFIYKHDIAYIAEEVGKTRRILRSAADDAITPEPADPSE